MKTQEYYDSKVLDDLLEYIKEDKNIDFPSYRLLRNKIFLARLKIKGELIQAYSQGRSAELQRQKVKQQIEVKLSIMNIKKIILLDILFMALALIIASVIFYSSKY